MATERNKLMELLKVKYPTLFISTTEAFNGTDGGVWLSGESGVTDKGGMKLFDYYASYRLDPRGSYKNGVRYHLANFLEKHGWQAEWNDPGTIMLWKI
jgi:hypothetical protein